MTPGTFKSLDANPGGTLELLSKYVDRIKLIFDLAFRKGDGTAYTPSDKGKKATLLFRGGDDMKSLFQHVGKVLDNDTFDAAVKKIEDGLEAQTNNVVQRNLLLANYPQGSKSFDRWYKEVSNGAKIINYENYDWKQATVDAILLQTSNPKLRERALQENITYNSLLTMGITKEQSMKGAPLLEKASGQTSSFTNQLYIKSEEVRKLQKENNRLKSKLPEFSFGRCGNAKCDKAEKCPAMGQKCSKCHKMNHFAKSCKARTTVRPTRRLSSAEECDSAESSGRIVVGKLESHSITAKVTIQDMPVLLATDTGVPKTLLNRNDWEKVKHKCKFVKTSKRFRPFRTSYHLPIRRKAEVVMKAVSGAEILSYIYIVDDKNEQSLLDEKDAISLGIIHFNPEGAKVAVLHWDDSADKPVRSISYTTKTPSLPEGIISGGKTQQEIDTLMTNIVNKFPNLFSNKTGKFISSSFV